MPFHAASVPSAFIPAAAIPNPGRAAAALRMTDWVTSGLRALPSPAGKSLRQVSNRLVARVPVTKAAGRLTAGWAAWRDLTGIRALATFSAYAVLIALFGRVDTFYWGLMVAPAILIGLAFVPDGMRDLIAAAFPKKRKITVTRLNP